VTAPSGREPLTLQLRKASLFEGGGCERSEQTEGVCSVKEEMRGFMQDLKKKYQVFISSTYEDLKDERAAVTQCLLDNNCIPVGMEQFPSSNMSQMDYIKKMLDDCDYYILIVGGRYGSLDDDGVGYTEKEYDYAIQNGIPVMAFVFDHPEKLPFDKHDRTDTTREKFNEFRDKVLKSKKLVKFHSGISDLKANVATAINAAIRDYPAVGWVRGDTQMQSSAVKNEVQVISVKTKIYADETDAGVFTFDYSNNNGRFSIGKGEYLFTTQWSKASNTSIYAYNDCSNIDSIARIKAPCTLDKRLLTGEYDFSSRCRNPKIGDIIIWKNIFGNYAATQIVSISDDTRGANHDELTCEYVIYTKSECKISKS
jgi:nucleoside 2-deoxyribosyltransferase